MKRSHNKGEKGPHRHKKKQPAEAIAHCIICHGAFQRYPEHLPLLLRIQMHYIKKPSHHARLDPRIVAALRSEPGV